MPSPIIKVTNLSKSYTLNHEGTERYTALRDVVTNKVKKLFSFPKSLLTPKQHNNSTTEEFWALKDINFEIQQGDRVGIIGRNGAGKSTLLKILSRITEPTKGRIELNGRVASLLEVGTGFHPELTGRENIFLNGAILGMSRAEIKRKFDEIVDFAEIERFLDTPVKRYSSGMYVRLAFAVAAHLEPEILIVDEVLAVGDAQFQKKCLGKMEDVSKNEGRTVLFVSHNISAIKLLCNNAIYLKDGKIISVGEINNVVNNYLSSNKQQIHSRFVAELIMNKDIQLVESFVSDELLNPMDSFEIMDNIYITLKIHCTKIIPNIYGYIQVKNNLEEAIIESDTMDYLPNILEDLKLGLNIFRLRINNNILSTGDYSLYLSFAGNFSNSHTVEIPGEILRFEIVDTQTSRGHLRGSKSSFLIKWIKQNVE